MLSRPHGNPHDCCREGNSSIRSEDLRDAQVQVKQEQVIDASVAEVGDRPGYDLRPYDSLQTPHDTGSPLFLTTLRPARVHHVPGSGGSGPAADT